MQPNLLDIFSAQGYMGLIQMLITILIALYAIYAFIIIRQVTLLNKSFTTDAAPLFKMTAVIHFFAALALLLVAILLL